VNGCEGSVCDRQANARDLSVRWPDGGRTPSGREAEIESIERVLGPIPADALNRRRQARPWRRGFPEPDESRAGSGRSGTGGPVLLHGGDAGESRAARPPRRDRGRERLRSFRVCSLSRQARGVLQRTTAVERAGRRVAPDGSSRSRLGRIAPGVRRHRRSSANSLRLPTKDRPEDERCRPLRRKRRVEAHAAERSWETPAVATPQGK